MTQHRTTRFLLGAITAAGAVLTAAAPAHAQWDQPGNHRNHLEIELHLDANGSYYEYGTGYGIGVRVDIPILARGFIPSINNSVAIGVGADIIRNAQVLYSGWSLQIPVVLQWNFHVSPWWTLFFEPGVFISTLFASCATGVGDPACNDFYVVPEFAIGAKWHWGGAQTFPALVMRVGWPSGLSLGVSF